MKFNDMSVEQLKNTINQLEQELKRRMFQHALEKATETIKNWPEWKKNILGKYDWPDDSIFRQ